MANTNTGVLDTANQASGIITWTPTNSSPTTQNPSPVNPSISPVVSNWVTALNTQTNQQVAEPTVSTPTPTAPVASTTPTTPNTDEWTKLSSNVSPSNVQIWGSQEKTTVSTPEWTTTTTKESPVVNYNQWQGREQDILNNLNEEAKNDAITQKALQTWDLATFRLKYWYDQADATKKQMLDAFFQANQPKNSDSFLQMLANGQTIENSQYASSPAAADAQHRFDLIGSYKGASADNLYSAMVTGQIVPWSEPYNDLVKLNGGIETPDMLAAKAKYQQKITSDQINRDAWVSGGYALKETGTTQNVSDSLVNSKGIDYAKEFQKDVANNPDIVNLSQQVNATDKQINDLEADKALTIKKIAADHPWLNSGLLLEIANEQNAPINEQITKLQNDRAYQAANLDYKTSLASKMFDYKFQQAQSELAYQRQVAQTQQAQGFQTNLLGLQQAYANPDINSTDPQIANIAAQKAVAADLTFAQTNGIPVRRWAGQIISDAQAYAQQNGVSLGKALDATFTQPLHSKPEYQQVMKDLQNRNNPSFIKSTTPDWKQDNSWNWYNANGIESPVLQISKNPPLGTKDSTGYKNASQAKDGTVYWSCWQFANDLSGVWSEPGWDDTIAGRTKTYTDTAPVVWGMVFEAGPQLDAKNWHVAVVTKINPDGSLQVRESNFFWDDKVHDRTISANEVKSMVKWYYNNTPLAGGQSQNWANSEFTQVAKELVDGKTKVSDLKTLWYNVNEIKQIQDEKLRLENEKWGELSPDEQTLVKALQTYDLDPNKLPWGMSKEAQASKKRILAAAFNDPNYDMKKYPAQQALYKSWTSWSMMNNNNGITTVTRHMMELKPALEALQNGDIKKFNELWNSADTQFGVADTNDANVIAQAVGSEMAKVYKWNASPTTDEINEWSSKISTALSSGQQAWLLKTLSKLLYGKITSNAQNYNRTMWEKPQSIFDPESEQFLRDYGVDVSKDFKTTSWETNNQSWTVQYNWYNLPH